MDREHWISGDQGLESEEGQIVYAFEFLLKVALLKLLGIDVRWNTLG